MPLRLPTDPPLVEVTLGQVLWRVHLLRFAPLWFGPGTGAPPKGRFDAPGGEYGVCYFGEHLGVAILETLVRGRSRPLIARAELDVRGGSAFGVAAPLRMLQLEGAGLPSFGVSAHEVMGSRYGPCQELARRLHARFPDVDGVQYRSRWDSASLCWAVFDRAQTRIGGLVRTHRLDDPAVVVPALRPYRHVGVI
jgi:RES domain